MKRHSRTEGMIPDLLFFWAVLFLWSQILFLVAPDTIFAQQEREGKDQSAFAWDFGKFADDIKGGFDYLFKALISGTAQRPSHSTQNPNNDFLKIPRYSGDLEVRPDFSLNYWRLNLLFKPRLNLKWEHWEEGSRSGDNHVSDDWYVNEWLVRLKVAEGLFASYGRENLQWGPSFFLSPSNPFFRDNGQSNPKREVPGMDFARLVWIPSSSWTASFIANVNRGRQEFLYDFEPTYALKLDYTTSRKYASLIGSYQEKNRATLGAFAGWTVSDAFLLYGEGALSQGTNALYPTQDPATPFGIKMSSIKDDETSLEGIFLVGGSYTLRAGPTLTLEYVFNTAGYSEKKAELYYQLRRQASEDFFSPIRDTRNLSYLTLSQTLDPKLRLLRKNYVMLQYQQLQIWNVLNLILRYTINLNDYSSRLNPIAEYDIGKHFQLYLIGSQNFGSQKTEFSSIVRYSWMLGLEYTF
jgi:hypothetical protein